MGKRFSSFVGLNFGVWVSFEKMGHTGFGDAGLTYVQKMLAYGCGVGFCFCPCFL